MSLRERTVFVTGAARGIGEHVARVAAARGARFFLAGLEPERLAGLARELDAGWAECDVTDQASLAAAVESTVDVQARWAASVGSTAAIRWVR